MTSMKAITKLSAIALLVIPIPILALGDFSLETAGQTFQGLIVQAIDLLQLLYPILFTLAFLLFFWGLSKFILSAGNEAEVEKGKNYILWAILVLFILLTSRSIIDLITTEFFDKSPAIPILPK